MEISTYPTDSIIQRIIPGSMLGIIFSKGFEKAYKYFKGNDAEMPDTVEERMEFITGLSDSEDAYMYCFDEDEEGYPISVHEDYIVIYMNDLSDYIGETRHGNQYERLEYFDVIANLEHRTLRKLMVKITDMLTYKLFWVSDYFHIVEHADEIASLDKEENSGYDDEFIESAKDFLCDLRIVEKKLKAAKNILLDKLERDLMREDIDAYLLYKKHKYSIEKFMNEFQSWHFMQSQDESDNGMFDINQLLFIMVMKDDESCFETAEIESLYYSVDQSGVSNTLSNLIIDKDGIIINDSKKLIKDTEMFESIKDFYQQVKYYVNETDKL